MPVSDTRLRLPMVVHCATEADCVMGSEAWCSLLALGGLTSCNSDIDMPESVMSDPWGLAGDVFDSACARSDVID